MSSGAETDDRDYLTRYARLPDVGWSAVTIALGLMIAFVVALTSVSVVGSFDPGLETQAGKLLAQLVFGLSFAGTAVGLALVDAGGDIRGAMRQLGFRRVALSMFGLALVAWLAYFVFQLAAGSLIDPDQDPITDKLGTDEGSVLSVLAAGMLVVVLAAFAEEIFFRGFLFRGLRKTGASLWPAALISSAVWALLHLTGGDLGVAGVLFVLGLVLAWLYERSGSLWVPISVHLLNNTLAFLALLNA